MNFSANAFLASVFISFSTAASAATVDFSGFSAGDVLGANTVLGGGIVADISSSPSTAAHRPMIFDTDNPTGGDDDLASPFENAVDPLDDRGFGKALIVQENDSTVPDDRGAGGSLTFDFISGPIALGTVFLLDVRAEAFVELFDGLTTVSKIEVTSTNESDTGNNPNNNKFTLLDFGGAVGDKMVVDFRTDSGALGEFNATVVPVPATLPLMLGGVGLLAWIRRRKAVR